VGARERLEVLARRRANRGGIVVDDDGTVLQRVDQRPGARSLLVEPGLRGSAVVGPRQRRDPLVVDVGSLGDVVGALGGELLDVL
jgi:hypothetical protein